MDVDFDLRCNSSIWSVSAALKIVSVTTAKHACIRWEQYLFLFGRFCFLKRLAGLAGAARLAGLAGLAGLAELAGLALVALDVRIAYVGDGERLQRQVQSIYEAVP